MAPRSILTTTIAVAVAVAAALFPSARAATYENPLNNYTCRSTAHPNPVVLLHGLGATYYEDLNVMQSFLTQQGFCTFSLTYGAVSGFPFIGGLEHISTSAGEIASFIASVSKRTGGSKVDLVGQSEGAFQSLYVRKFYSALVGSIIERTIAIAPPTHGTSFENLVSLMDDVDSTLDTSLLDSILGTVCPACNDLATPSSSSSSNSNTQGSAVLQLAYDGTPIVQAGNTVTIIASRDDELVTPPTTSFISNTTEVAKGGTVNNVWVQDFCPDDVTGHLDEGYDYNVWQIVLNALEDDLERQFECLADSVPGRGRG
jgi:hypothetical protein